MSELVTIPLVVANEMQSHRLTVEVTDGMETGHLPGVVDVMQGDDVTWGVLRQQLVNSIAHPTGVGSEKFEELADAHVQRLRSSGAVIIAATVDPKQDADVPGAAHRLYTIRRGIAQQDGLKAA